MLILGGVGSFDARHLMNIMVGMMTSAESPEMVV